MDLGINQYGFTVDLIRLRQILLCVHYGFTMNLQWIHYGFNAYLLLID